MSFKIIRVLCVGGFVATLALPNLVEARGTLSAEAFVGSSFTPITNWENFWNFSNSDEKFTSPGQVNFGGSIGAQFGRHRLFLEYEKFEISPNLKTDIFSTDSLGNVLDTVPLVIGWQFRASPLTTGYEFLIRRAQGGGVNASIGFGVTHYQVQLLAVSKLFLGSGMEFRDSTNLEGYGVQLRSSIGLTVNEHLSVVSGLVYRFTEKLQYESGYTRESIMRLDGITLRVGVRAQY